MIGRWGLYSDLLRELRAAGFAPDQAADAARIAERAIRERRDHFIRAAKKSGMSLRAIARVWGLSHEQTRRLLSPDTGRNVTAEKNTISDAG